MPIGIAIIGIPLVLFAGFSALGIGNYLLQFLHFYFVHCCLFFSCLKTKTQGTGIGRIKRNDCAYRRRDFAFVMIPRFRREPPWSIITGIAFGPEAAFFAVRCPPVCNFFIRPGNLDSVPNVCMGTDRMHQLGRVFQRIVKEKNRFSFLPVLLRKPSPS